MHFDSCALTRKDKGAGKSQFHLSVGGQFEQLKLYLRAHNGPIVMGSANHCCGNNVTFNLKFAVDCTPGLLPSDGIQSIRMEALDLGTMLVKEQKLGGYLTIGIVDLSSIVEREVREHIHSFIRKVQLNWGEKRMSISSMLNKLVMYNAPRRAGEC